MPLAETMWLPMEPEVLVEEVVRLVERDRANPGSREEVAPKAQEEAEVGTCLDRVEGSTDTWGREEEPWLVVEQLRRKPYPGERLHLGVRRSWFENTV